MNLENHYYDDIDGISDERDILITKGRSIGIEKEGDSETTLEITDIMPSIENTRHNRSKDVQNSYRRISLHISSSLHSRAKRAAIEDDETLNSLVVGLLHQFVDNRDKEREKRNQK